MGKEKGGKGKGKAPAAATTATTGGGAKTATTSGAVTTAATISGAGAAKTATTKGGATATKKVEDTSSKFKTNSRADIEKIEAEGRRRCSYNTWMAIFAYRIARTRNHTYWLEEHLKMLRKLDPAFKGSTVFDAIEYRVPSYALHRCRAKDHDVDRMWATNLPETLSQLNIYGVTCSN